MSNRLGSRRGQGKRQMAKNRPGSFVINNLTIVNQDKDAIGVSGICTDIKIYESIQNYFVKGKMTLVDGIGLIKNYKLVGQESLTIDIDTANGNFRKVFRIYAIDNLAGNPVKQAMAYRIHFCDPKMITAKTKRLSKTLRGSFSSMLLQVLQEDAGFKSQRLITDTTDYWEETSPTNLQIVCPNWTVEKFIDVCVKNANRDSQDNSYKQSMFFYQTMNGSFRFCSFDTMVRELEEPVIFDMGTRQHIDNLEVDDDYPGIGPNTQIFGFIQPKRADILNGFTSGAYSSKQMTYDPIRKVIEDNVYSLSDSFKKESQSHVSKFPLINLEDEEIVYGAERRESGASTYQLSEDFADLAPKDRFDSYLKYDVNPTNAFSDEAKLIDTNSSETKTQQLGIEKRDTGDLERTSLLSTFNQNSMIASIPFRTNIECGTTVRLKFPPFQPQDNENDRDLMQDERYLVTHVRFHILPLDNSGTCNLTCVKESLAKDIREFFPLDELNATVITE